MLLLLDSTPAHQAMRSLWIYPYPAQSDDFLLLHYENSYGQPEAAHTSIYRHPWSDHDYMGLAAEVEIFRESDDGFKVRLIAYSWNVWEPGQSPTAFERFNGCSVQAWETHETLGQFEYARAFAQFAWASWRSSGTGGSAGMLWRDDLDRNLNAVADLALMV